jgi:co-chaperonin GroES (HSP10)
MFFQPLHGLVTIVLDPPQTKTDGGLILPDNFDTFRTGTIRCVGLGRLCENNSRESMPLTPGDRVLIGAGTRKQVGPNDWRVVPEYATIKDNDGVEVALVNFTSILGIVEYHS